MTILLRLNRVGGCPLTRAHAYILSWPLPSSTSIMQLFREKALVVYDGQVVPVLKRYVYRDGALYVVHTRDHKGDLQRHYQVTFGQLVSAINSYARFCVGDKLELGTFDKYVKARWWNCTRGTVVYRINTLFDDGVSWCTTQEELIKRVEHVTM